MREDMKLFKVDMAYGGVFYVLAYGYDEAIGKAKSLCGFLGGADTVDRITEIGTVGHTVAL